jgi:hypothetical protein
MAIAPLVGEGESQRKNKNKQKNCYQTDEDFLCLHSIWEQIREGRKMKRTAQIAVIGALLAVGIAQSYAQSNAVVVSQLNVALSGFSGGSDTATPVRLSNKDIISALNASSGGFSFGKTAKLMMVVPAAGGSPSFIVREGSTDTDVSNFFSTGSSDVVSNGKQQYEIFNLTFDNGGGTSFDVSGFATDRIGKVTGRDTGVLDGQVTSFNSSVSGTGEVSGTFAVLKGTVNGSGAKGELH